jgi:hypothetical protein
MQKVCFRLHIISHAEKTFVHVFLFQLTYEAGEKVYFFASWLI